MNELSLFSGAGGGLLATQHLLGWTTIGYVEIPQGSTIDVAGFLGRYVGVVASAKRLQTGGVDPVPVYVARDLILLQPAATTDSSVQD